MKVLVADDDAAVREMLVEFLTRHGVVVVPAANGVETLGRVTRSRLNREPFDVIVLDLHMPQLGGIQALRKIRALDPSVAVIVLTAALEPALHRQATALGAKAIFPKPAHLATLWAAIEGHVPSRPVDEAALTTVFGGTPAARKPRSETRILVVDDDANVRATLVDMLEHRGYATAEAVDGPGAVRALTIHQPPDVILLDMVMPGLSGADALPTLRALAPRAPVIMVTGNLDLELAKRTLARGAFDYLVKPVNFAHLTQSVEMALAIAALEPDPPSASRDEPDPRGDGGGAR